MKNLVLLISLMFILPSFALPTQSKPENQLSNKKHIDITWTSLAGCKVHIVGDLEYTIMPPVILGFTGTISISGGSGCNNGTNTFALAGSSDLIATLDNTNPCYVKKITWKAKTLRSDVAEILNSEQSNTILVGEMRKLCNAE